MEVKMEVKKEVKKEVNSLCSWTIVYSLKMVSSSTQCFTSMSEAN